jgi:hypothetical protein
MEPDHIYKKGTNEQTSESQDRTNMKQTTTNPVHPTQENDPTNTVSHAKEENSVHKVSSDNGSDDDPFSNSEEDESVTLGDSDTDSDEESDGEDDPDYDPTLEDFIEEDAEEEEDEDGDEDEDGEDHEDGEDEEEIEWDDTPPPKMQFFPGRHQMMLIIPPPPPPRERHAHAHEDPQPPSRKRMRGEEYTFTQGMTPEEKSYWRNLDETKKTEFLEMDKRMKDIQQKGKMPMRFKFLSSDIETTTKAIILAKLDQFQNMHEGSGEYYKLRNWLHSIARLPLGNYYPLKVSPSDPYEKIAGFLKDSRMTLDTKVFGHSDAKSQIMRIFAQWVSNPTSKGHCIGIQGPPGVGKTELVKTGICKALGLPFGFVALGGASDASFLEGHGFTYEGSTYGKIAEILMKAQCMNPVIFFDELDKVSTTSRGEEIIGVLTHLTDSTQNERFTDRYFGGVELNLSRALIIFSYNDESLINPILKDRMISIRVKGYNLKEKLTIARDYLLPEILKQYNLTPNDIKFPLSVIETIIHRVPQEEGVRNLKRGLESVVSWINMHRYVPPENGELDTQFPLTVSEEHIHKYLYVSEDPTAMRPEVARMMYI